MVNIPKLMQIQNEERNENSLKWKEVRDKKVFERRKRWLLQDIENLVYPDIFSDKSMLDTLEKLREFVKEIYILKYLLSRTTESINIDSYDLTKGLL